MSAFKTGFVSKTAVAEFQTLYREEFGGELAFDEAEERAIKVLGLFSLLSRGRSSASKFAASEMESKCLRYIETQLKMEKQPTVRGVSYVLGRRSARTGFKMMNRLLARGFLKRDQQGNLTIVHVD